MKNLPVRFTINQIIFGEDKKTDPSIFATIKEYETETQDISRSPDDPEDKEILSVKRVHKNVVDDRFLTIFFQEGDKYPYSPKVIDENLKESDNPRAPELIELNKHLFVLVDMEKGLLYLNNQKRKNEIRLWLKKKLDKEVEIKATFLESDFVPRLRSLDEVSFAVVPDLFSTLSENTLSKHLLEDVYGYGAKRASLSFKYYGRNVDEPIRKRLLGLLKQKHSLKTVTVIGRGDDGLEMVLNMEEVANRIQVIVKCDDNLLPAEEVVFGSLIGEIKTTHD